MTRQERREKRRNKVKFQKHGYKSLLIAQEQIIKRGIGREFPKKTLTLKDSKK